MIIQSISVKQRLKTNEGRNSFAGIPHSSVHGQGISLTSLVLAWFQ